MWICPDCGKNDHLMVTIVTTANLTQDADGDNFETEVMGDHEWDENSSMACGSCGNIGTVGQFECNLPIQPTNPCGPMSPNATITSLPPYRRRQRDGE